MQKKSGKEVKAVGPAQPKKPEEADEADPGKVEKVKAEQTKLKKGKYGKVEVKPFKPKDESDDADEEETSWIELQMVDDTSTTDNRWNRECDVANLVATSLDRRDWQDVLAVERDRVDHVSNRDTDGESGTTFLTDHFCA